MTPLLDAIGRRIRTMLGPEVPVAFSLPEGVSYQQVTTYIAAELAKQGIKDAYVSDLYENEAVYCVYGQNGPATYYKRGYALDGTDVAFTSEPMAVIQRTVYEPIAAEAYTEEPFQVFLDVPQAFIADTVPEWIPFLPKPGQYKHPTYGDIDLTRQSNEERVASVKNRVYQEHIPLDAEHQTKLSGAVGYLRELKMNDDGSADARIEWSDRGKKLMEGGGFRYVSPEWFRTWRDPATGEEHRNVIAGGAITTRPFFKEKALRALVASERGAEVLDRKAIETLSEVTNDGAGQAGDGTTGLDGTASGGSSGSGQAIAGNSRAGQPDASGAGGAGEGVTDGRTQAARGTEAKPDADPDATRATEGLGRGALAQSGDALPSTTKQKETRTMADDQTFTAAEIEAKIETARKAAIEEVTTTFAEQLKTEKDAREASEAEAATLKGSVAELQKANRNNRFTEIVTGRGGANDGAPWVGDAGKHVEMLESLASKFGEEDPLFVQYVESQTAAAQQVKEANLFAEIGSASSGAVSDPERRLDQLTEERLKTHESESQEQAYAEVLKTAEGRKLYSQIPVRGQ